MDRMLLDPDTIQRLATILKETGLTEIELQDGNARLRLVRAHASATPAPQPAYAPPPAAAPVTPPIAPAPDIPPEGAITSPMVGIAYLAPEAGAPPYVTLGQAVTAGQTLMLIEAMKTFNQIKAPRAGTVTQILVTPGAPVEYGQPLLVLAPLTSPTAA